VTQALASAQPIRMTPIPPHLFFIIDAVSSNPVAERAGRSHVEARSLVEI